MEQTRPILRLDAREITQSLGGCRAGAEFLARCPAHDDRTPSLSIRDVGCRVLVHCHAGCGQDAVINALATRGLWPGSTSDELRNVLPLARPSHANGSSDNGTRIATALRLWGECEDPSGTIVERYLNNRELALDGAMAWNVIRFHRACPFGRDEAGEPAFKPVLVALFRDVLSNAPRALLRVALNADGTKVGKKMIGPVGGCAVKLDADEDVEEGLGIAEGLETALAVQAAGWRPVWTTGSAGSLANFPVLGGIGALTIFADHDEAGVAAAIQCKKRWQAAGRGVRIVMPRAVGCDWADEWGVR